jgi:hypothetical protein
MHTSIYTHVIVRYTYINRKKKILRSIHYDTYTRHCLFQEESRPNKLSGQPYKLQDLYHILYRRIYGSTQLKLTVMIIPQTIYIFESTIS